MYRLVECGFIPRKLYIFNILICLMSRVTFFTYGSCECQLILVNSGGC